jgi:NhaP-type Na+/H+ or K+/H+ antiporter
MAHTHTQTEERREQTHEGAHEGSAGHTAGFWRHYLEMLGVMVAGMLSAAVIISVAVRASSWDQVTIVYPTQALVAMAVGMTVPMVLWMLHRRMGRRNAAEMGAAMAIPVIPFLCLVWFHVTNSAQCGIYCVFTAVAMLVLMRYRREEYSAHSAHRV